MSDFNEKCKEFLIELGKKERKYNTEMSMDNNIIKELFENFCGEFIAIDSKSEVKLNPFNSLNTDNYVSEPSILGLKLSILERFKDGGFRDLAEIAIYIDKFNKGNHEHINVFFNWYKNNGKKAELDKIVKELRL